MPILATDAWEEARLEAEALVAPYPHLDVVPHVFTALSGVLWSASYVLMTMKAFKDKSYGMPIYCLCLNITWEGIYGFIYGSGPLNQFVFAQWMIVDLFLFYATVKFGADEWRHQPLVAKNLAWIIIVGAVVSLWLHVSMAASLIPVIGRRIVFFTAWTLQIIINAGSIAQILCRGSTRGHSWGIWWTRMLGTVAAGCCFYWRIWYWPERFDYAWSPYGAFLLVGSHLFDFLYPFAFVYVRNWEKDQAEKTKRQ